MSLADEFRREREVRIASNRGSELASAAAAFMAASVVPKYSYNFEWLGRPIIQYPQDIVAFQEIVWKVRPDLIIETGIAHGGSLILSASLLAMLDYCDAVSKGCVVDPKQSRRKVVGIDIEIRKHNEAAVREHPFAALIKMIEGSSTDRRIVAQVKELAKKHQTVLVSLDSNHSHEHVLAELEAYAPLVSVGSYCIVFDTFVEDLDQHLVGDRPWGPGDSPKTAVREFLKHNADFSIDGQIDNKLLITVAPGGFLRRIA